MTNFFRSTEEEVKLLVRLIICHPPPTENSTIQNHPLFPLQQHRMGMAHQGSTSPSGGLFSNVIMEPQRGKIGFIQQLVSYKSNAFRSHPLFPLLRDLIIADMNLNSATFPFQLIAKLLQNYLQRNPPSGQYQSYHALESIIMDALKYAHRSVIGNYQSTTTPFYSPAVKCRFWVQPCNCVPTKLFCSFYIQRGSTS